MINFKHPTFEELIEKEWLVTNGLGGYAASTLSGANTRRYHGLLVASFNPPTDRRVLVTKIEEAIMFHRDSVVGLSANQYPGTVHPKGFEFLESFERLPIPSFGFVINSCKLAKRVFMPYGSNTTVVEYENTGACAFELQLTPLFAHRDYHSLFLQNISSNFWTEWITPNIARVFAHYGAPALYFSFSEGEFRESRNWFKNFEYAKEKYRGLDYREDAFALGAVVCNLLPGSKIHLVFSLEEEMAKADFEDLKNKEIGRIGKIRGGGTDFHADLKTAADQFIVERKSSGGKTLIAGYHWFTDWGRDTMIAMRGLVVAQGKKEMAESILKTFLLYLDGGMLPNRFPDQGEELEYNTADATLWLFVVLHEYVEKFGDWAFIKTILPQLTAILEAHLQGARYNIHPLKEGLLFCGEGLSQLTWMDARVGDYVVTPRHGCPVEINALWYNALMIYNRFLDLLGSDLANFEELAAKVKMNFKQYFLNEKGYLNDVIIPGEYIDDSIRPNQIYALSLPFPLLGKKEGNIVLNIVKEKLLTPLGLRSLDPTHPDFVATYGGDQWHRDTAYHQGTVWSFLLGEYWLAYLKIQGINEKSKAEVLEMMAPLRRHFYEAGCIHGISEIFDGGEPGTGRGCVQQAWSVGMVLKVLAEMEEAKPSKKLKHKI